MLNELETFVALFNDLKAKVNESSTTLTWLAEQRADVRRLAFLVGESAEKIRKARAGSADRHSVVPRGFVTAWKEFESKFEQIISDILESERTAGAEEFLNEIKELAERKGTDVNSFLEQLVEELESRRQPGDSFDPTQDDPASLIERVFMTFEDIVDQSLWDDEEGDKAIGAWRFFDETLRVSHREIYDRWITAPELLIPSHVLRVNPQPVFELYNEAVRCYMFGNKIAAVSMCRALMEHILKKHYKIEEDDLHKMITIAEVRHSHLKKMKLHQKRKLANTMMHKYEKHSGIDDKDVVDFLKILQAMTLRIPR